MDKEKRLSTDDVKFIQVEMTEDDEIMVDVIDNALDYLDKYGNFFSEPITVQDMRDWLKSKLPSKYTENKKQSNWI
jgi:hypothetical protein